MCGNTGLPLRGLVEFAQASCAPFPFQTHRSCEVPISKITSGSPKLSRARSGSTTQQSVWRPRPSDVRTSTFPKVLLRGSSRAFLKKIRQSFGVQLPKPVDVALSLIPQVRLLESYYQLFWESFTSTLESNCQFARRLAHFASRNTHREVHLPLPRTASESNCRCYRGRFHVCPEMVQKDPGVPSPPDTRRVWRGTGV